MEKSEQVQAGRKYATAAVLRILKNHPAAVEDVLQESCIKAYLGNFRGDCAFNSWFCRIAINEAFMFLRKRYTQDVSLDGKYEWLQYTRPNPEQQAIGTERRRILAKSICQLSPKRRKAILAFVAANRGELVNTSTEKSRRHKGFEDLKRMLA